MQGVNCVAPGPAYIFHKTWLRKGRWRWSGCEMLVIRHGFLKRLIALRWLRWMMRWAMMHCQQLHLRCGVNLVSWCVVPWAPGRAEAKWVLTAEMSKEGGAEELRHLQHERQCREERCQQLEWSRWRHQEPRVRGMQTWKRSQPWTSPWSPNWNLCQRHGASRGAHDRASTGESFGDSLWPWCHQTCCQRTDSSQGSSHPQPHSDCQPEVEAFGQLLWTQGSALCRGTLWSRSWQVWSN